MSETLASAQVGKCAHTHTPRAGEPTPPPPIDAGYQVNIGKAGATSAEAPWAALRPVFFEAEGLGTHALDKRNDRPLPSHGCPHKITARWRCSTSRSHLSAARTGEDR